MTREIRLRPTLIDVPLKSRPSQLFRVSRPYIQLSRCERVEVTKFGILVKVHGVSNGLPGGQEVYGVRTDQNLNIGFEANEVSFGT